MSHDPYLLDAIEDEHAERAALARELEEEARAAAFEDLLASADIDHTHECRGCGSSIPCYTPSDECHDHPGDCCVGGPPAHDSRSF